MKKVVIAAQERIDHFEHTAIEFFRAVLGMDYGEYIAAVVSTALGMPEFAPTSPAPHQQELPLLSA